MENKVGKALEFATKAHGAIGQLRKYTGEPYINHPYTVMGILLSVGISSENVLCAALLHDTIEDTPVTPDEIREAFGEAVCDLVIELTDVYTSELHPDKNRKERKILERDRIGDISTDAKNIKLADLIDNSSSILSHDADFAKVYLIEKLAICDIISKDQRVNSELLRRAYSFLS